jgi:hypothetical protein
MQIEMNIQRIEELATFHDAELRHVSHNAALASLELGLEKADGRFSSLTLEQVVAYRVTDMRIQNVVSRLLVHGGNALFTEEELVERVSWISGTCDGEQLSDASALTKLVGRVKSGELLLFVLEPSWGAELAGIAGAIAI